LRFEHGARNDVLARDQFDLRLLAPAFAIDCRRNFRIGGGEISGEKIRSTRGEGRGN
jgi:hypothetical protein